MFKKLKEEFRKIYAKDSDYDYVMDDICENNRKNLMFLCSVCVVIFSILITLGFFNVGAKRQEVPMFFAAFAFALALLIFSKLSPKNNTIDLIIVYLAMGAVVIYGLFISYVTPEQYTVTFIAMMCILSMTFVDKPLRIGIAHIVVTSVCVGMICVHKTDSVRAADLINVISFSALSFVGGFVTVNVKVHGYVMDKLHEQDIEKGRQRLNAIETEALQLLTAVGATHDMIVSVNLTKNTYKLIGEESFVTQGDAIEGNFDDVIKIHAAKVIEEHRELYLKTFSREGLLDAYRAGKRQVYLEYCQCDDSGVPHWLGTHTMFLEDPHSTDITEITISQNIDERVRRDAETKAVLAAERDKAEQAQKAKTDFLFQMSHDIRTPMNAILGFANFIKSTDDIDLIRDNYILKLQTAGQQLLMLINDALEMSRIESGKLVFQREVQDIRSLISNVMAVMQIQAEEKGIELSSDFSLQHPIVNCDKNHMSRVIMNLLSNAVKFTPSGGKVSLSLKELPKSASGRTSFDLKISDTGVGMSPEFLKKAFDPFEREKSSTVSGIQGTGLGLTIVKRIVEAAGDTISVESKLGVGTTFTLNIALFRAELAELPNNDSDDLPLTEQMSAYFKGKRLLLAEDNEFNLTIARVLLENAGFTVETASDGRVAVNKLINAPTDDYYDAILMDVQMPVLDGYEATSEIRALKGPRADIPIIAVTANAFDTDKENASRAGMNGHISKPIDVALLYKTLWNICKD